MTGSALMGQPPNNQDDYWIIKGFTRVAGIPDGKINPNMGFPLPLKRPPNAAHETQGPGIIAGMVVAMVLVLLMTGTRLSLRFFRRDLRWGWDDWVIIPAAIGVIGWFATNIAMVVDGDGGQHLYDATYKELNWFIRLISIDQLLFFLTAGVIKISIVLFNKRLTGLTSKRWMIFHNIYLAMLVIFCLAAIFGNLFICSPGLAQFSLIRFGKSPKAPVCKGASTYNLAMNVIHIVADFTLLSTPLIVLWKIQMATSNKIRLLFLFSIGSVSCIGSVMRIVSSLSVGLDLTWSYTKVMNWTSVDIFFGITAACLPVLNAALPRKWRTLNNSRNSPVLKSWTKSLSRHDNKDDVEKLESQEAIHNPMVQQPPPQDDFHTESPLHDGRGAFSPPLVHTTPWNHAPPLRVPLPTHSGNISNEFDEARSSDAQWLSRDLKNEDLV